MKIETKFSYNDTVYAMSDNKVYSFNVERIEVTVTPKEPGAAFTGKNVDVVYFDYQCKRHFKEADCYSTKEELLASL